MLAHGRKLVLYFWELCITETSSADLRYLQLCSQPWWMWMSVSDEEVHGEEKRLALGETREFNPGVGVAVSSRAK